MNKNDRDALLSHIRDLAQKDFSLQEISKLVPQISRETIKKWAKENSISIKTKQQRDDEKSKKIFELYSSGLTVKKLRKLGYSYDFIKKSITKFGTKWRDRKTAAYDRSLTAEQALSRLPKNSNYTFVKKEQTSRGVYYYFLDGEGNLFSKTASHIHQGSPYITGRTLPYTYQDYLNRCDELGYELVKYTLGNIKEVPVTVRCKAKGHTRTIKIAHNLFLLPLECPLCNNRGTSSVETEISSFVESLGLKTTRYKFVKNGKGRKPEIDIYIPELKLGIEYCGLYWHSEASSRLSSPRQYHKSKMDLAKSNEIRLITIFEDEWLSRQSQVKNYLLSVFGKNTSIYARQTELKVISNNEASKFYDLYHIQGSAFNYIYSVGLYYKDELVAACSLGRHHRDSRRSITVLSRMCFKAGISVAGGPSKMFKALVSFARKNNYSSIISWSDNRWSEGNVYQKLGFKLEAELSPDYSYTKRRRRFPKQSKQKKHLLREGGTGNTELELARSLGYYRIWDCGKKRWAFEL